MNTDAFKVYSADLNKAKTDIDFLSSKAGVHDTEINYLEKTRGYIENQIV
ncbi:hypothetical protein [Bacillus weihaiensis]|nr:hypothetical protein [Bacillus weihaiensis]